MSRKRAATSAKIIDCHQGCAITDSDKTRICAVATTLSLEAVAAPTPPRKIMDEVEKKRRRKLAYQKWNEKEKTREQIAKRRLQSKKATEKFFAKVDDNLKVLRLQQLQDANRIEDTLIELGLGHTLIPVEYSGTTPASTVSPPPPIDIDMTPMVCTFAQESPIKALKLTVSSSSSGNSNPSDKSAINMEDEE